MKDLKYENIKHSLTLGKENRNMLARKKRNDTHFQLSETDYMHIEKNLNGC